MFVLQKDENNRIVSGQIVADGALVAQDQDTIIVEALPAGTITDYLYEDGEFVYSPTEDTIRQEEIAEIAELKANLLQTDYMVIKIAEGAATKEEYQDSINLRASWRARINELEEELNEQN